MLRYRFDITIKTDIIFSGVTGCQFAQPCTGLLVHYLIYPAGEWPSHASHVLITDKRFTQSSYSHNATTTRQNERVVPSLYHRCVPFADHKWRQILFPSFRQALRPNDGV